jgi:hypothetical protein
MNFTVVGEKRMAHILDTNSPEVLRWVVYSQWLSAARPRQNTLVITPGVG